LHKETRLGICNLLPPKDGEVTCTCIGTSDQRIIKLGNSKHAQRRTKSRCRITNGQANAISASHKAMTDWFRDNVGARQITSEVPFSALADDSTICTGIIDLLVEAPDGYWVIDHKTDRATEEDDIFDQYWPQLQAYRDSLENLGHTVAGVGLNLVNEGKLLLARTPDGS